MGRKQSAVAAANELPVCPDGNEKLSGSAISCVASVGSAKNGRSRPMMFLEAKLADKIGAHNRDDDDTAVESVFFFAQQQSCDDEPDECHVSQGCDERHGRIHRRRLKCVVYRMENGVVYVGKSFEHGWHCNSVKTFGERRYEFGA